MMQRLAITGLGVVSPFGESVPQLLDDIASGRMAVSEMEPTGRPGRLLPVVQCRDFDARRHLPPMKVRRWDPCSRFAAVASKLALEDAGFQFPTGEAVGMLASTWSSGATPLADFMTVLFRDSPEAAPPMLFPYTVANGAGSQAAIELGIAGPIATLSHRGVVFADSLFYASILLSEGRADAVVVVATDEINPTYLRAWDDLGIVAAPGREGLVLGEGAYAMVVERPDRALERGTSIRAFISGIGFRNASCGRHRYATDPDAFAGSDRDALERAGRFPADVDFLVLADNGRSPEARAEREGVRSLFPDRLPCSVRWKTVLGDGAVGAAGQAAVAAAALDLGQLPPDRGGALPGSDTGPPDEFRVGLVHFSGAGGAHFSLLLESADEGSDTIAVPRSSP